MNVPQSISKQSRNRSSDSSLAKEHEKKSFYEAEFETDRDLLLGLARLSDEKKTVGRHLIEIEHC